jgi:hypothetical protein
MNLDELVEIDLANPLVNGDQLLCIMKLDFFSENITTWDPIIIAT